MKFSWLGTGGSAAQSHALLLNRATGSRLSRAGEALISLQRRFGNRYLQRVLKLARKKEEEAEVAPEIESAIERERDGGGQPLDGSLRFQMETVFGASFSGVRLHTGSVAHWLNEAVNSIAFTTGQDIFFCQGAFDPGSSTGKELLAHELTHVVQQSGGTVQGRFVVGGPGDVYEQEADKVANEVVVNLERAPNLRGQSSPACVQRACACGGHSASGSECEECRAKRLLSLRPSSHSHVSVQRACVGGTWNFEYDGCSLPASLASFLGIDKDNPAGGSDTQFGLAIPSSAGGRACDRHDECYQTCNPFGKSACDQQFLADMLAICAASSESASVKAGCVAWANAYFGGVSLGGGFAFGQRQAQVCGCSLLG